MTSISLNEQQDKYRLKKELVKTTLRMAMVYDSHVPDTLTLIRVLEGVAVVGQASQVFRKKKGRTVIDIYMKFLPTDGPVVESLMTLLKEIKSLPGVEVIKVLTVDDREFSHKGKPVVV
tara:strand:+ start:858 stop:1214 length:357 start_codon:yes stop_codon:yes gene_type:complete